MRSNFAALLSTGVALALAVSSCRAPRDRGPVVEDLAAALPWAETASERERLDLGSAEAQGRLLHGWSWRETAADGSDYLWAVGGESALRFYVGEARPLALGLRTWPYPFDGGPRQAVELEVDGAPLARFDLPDNWHERLVELPADALRPGWNTLTLRFRRVRRPRPGERDRRALTAAIDWIRFEGLSGAEPIADADAARLDLPAGSRADFYLDPAGPAVLEVSELQLAAGVSLTIEATADAKRGGGATRTAVLERGGETLSVPLGGGGPLRLRLTVPPGPAGGARLTGAGVRDAGAAPSPSPRATSPDAARSRPAPARTRRPNVVLYVLDTLRADRLGAWGHPAPVSPALDAFSAGAVRFERLVAQAPSTLPAMASVFTGLSPRSHGVVVQGKGRRIPDALPILGEMLRDAGYATGAFVANGFVSAGYGFARGFDRFETLFDRGVRAGDLQRRALAWLDERPEGRPFFLWLHPVDPHDPYDPPPEERRRFAPGVDDPGLGSVERMLALKRSSEPPPPGLARDLMALYDGEIAAFDRAFGEFLGALEARGLDRDTLLIFLSDHGEEFHEHGSWTHGHALWAELLDVPLVLRFPGGEHGGRTVALPVQHLDLLPTLVDHLGLEGAPPLPGRSLMPLVAGEVDARDAWIDRPIFSYYHDKMASVVRGDWKLVLELLPSGAVAAERLFHRPDDPGELDDLSAERPVLAGYLRSLVRREMHLRRALAAAEEAAPDAETLQRLRALGYLQ